MSREVCCGQERKLCRFAGRDGEVFGVRGVGISPGGVPYLSLALCRMLSGMASFAGSATGLTPKESPSSPGVLSVLLFVGISRRKRGVVLR